MPAMTSDDKTKFFSELESMLARLDDALSAKQSERQLEKSVASFVVALGAVLLSIVFSRQCAEETDDVLAEHGLTTRDVAMRRDASYHAKLTSVFGPILVCMHAFRAPSAAFGDAGAIVVPAQEQFLVRYPACRSTLLCLEWETRLGADHPFRMAQDQLNLFTHQAVTLEDNTIATHLVNANQAIGPSWLYKTPAQIAKALEERVMCDLKTGLPVIDLSSDAHALRRYTDETWGRQWKMVNGVRIWAVDRFTGENIHLGGQFTWGDCEEVATIFARLIEDKILPQDGVYDGVQAQYVWIADGATWFAERIIPLFMGGITQILDVFDALEHASAYADAVVEKSQRSAWKKAVRHALIASDEPVVTSAPTAEEAIETEAEEAMTNVASALPPPIPSKRQPRKGHKKCYDSSRTLRRLKLRAERAEALLEEDTAIEKIVAMMPDESTITEGAAMDAHLNFVNYVGKRTEQMSYLEMQSRGLQIGSGAMESLHKSGSQVRLKRAGVTCLAETSQAILNWRMLRLAGRWDEYWSQPDLSKHMAEHWGGATEKQVQPIAA